MVKPEIPLSGGSQMARRGVFDEMALNIAWVNEHAAALVGS